MNYKDIKESLEALLRDLDGPDLAEAPLSLISDVLSGICPSSDEALIDLVGEALRDEFQVDSMSKADIILATNRVAMWRFFERYVCTAVKASGNHRYRNPFHSSEKLFSSVIAGWRPVINGETKRYCERTENGWELYEDLHSIAVLGLLEALERQAMDILAMSKKAQLIPFHLKLRFAIQRHMHQAIPDLIGGGIRIGFDSKAFAEDRPTLVSFDDFMKTVEDDPHDP